MKSLRGRLTLGVVLVLAAVLTAAGVLVSRYVDSSERAAMGRAAERRVREQHDPVEHADRVWELLKRVQDPASSRASTAAAAGVKGSGQGPAGSVQDASANSSPSSTSSE